METIKLENLEFCASTIELLQGKLLLIQGRNGMLGCAYLNIETADKLNSALAVVSGVNSYDDMLARPVIAVSRRASELGVVTGMSGRDALLLMK